MIKSHTLHGPLNSREQNDLLILSEEIHQIEIPSNLGNGILFRYGI